MDKVVLKNRLLKAKDLRKVLKNVRDKGYEVKTEEWYNHAIGGKEYWTTIWLENHQSINFNWTEGKDEYDDKACHIWGISY